MSESNQQDIRRIEDVTDDEIVDAVASFGMNGIDLEDSDDGNAVERMCRILRVVPSDAPPSVFDGGPFDEIDCRLAERIHALTSENDDARIVFNTVNLVTITPREWARRLAGLSENSIAAILSGRPQPTDDLTDDEIHRAAFGSS